ncbi:hypothetical protein GDO81_028166 [Engystomops pustulosus]|uniref:Uncharacterized protein n=1 Tax=Engystomops pustulosus TaxID=76066 RepID=A0AAV6ZP98_ENGPU|nr:hypothetical protein GDO81_028166 [Engystomops pustulosus]
MTFPKRKLTSGAGLAGIGETFARNVHQVAPHRFHPQGHSMTQGTTHRLNQTKGPRGNTLNPKQTISVVRKHEVPLMIAN